MTFNEKLAQYIDLVDSFGVLLHPQEKWVAIKLFSIENKKLKLKGTLKELSELLDTENTIYEDRLLYTFKILKAFGLINASKSKEGIVVVSINMIDKPDFDTKMAALGSLLTNKVIEPEFYDILKSAFMKTKDKHVVKTEEPIVKSNDINVDKPKAPRKINPDSAPALVKFYYNLMHDVFGGKYESPNILKEAHLLKIEMEKHNDSAEDTRKFFAFILNGAKEKDKFEHVATMGLYSRLRPTAYQKLIVEKNSKYDKFMKYEQVEHSEEDVMKSVREIYDICLKNGITEQEAIKTELRTAFNEELIEEFFKSLVNAK